MRLFNKVKEVVRTYVQKRKMDEFRKCRKMQVTTTVREDLHKLAVEKKIPWNYALQVGLRKVLKLSSEPTQAEEELQKRMDKVMKRLEIEARENLELKERIKKLEGTDDVF